MNEYLEEQVIIPSQSSLELMENATNLSAVLEKDGVLSSEMAAIDNAEVDDEASSPTLKLKRIRSDRQHSLERRITDWLDMQGIFQVDPSTKRDIYYENKRHALLALKLPQQLKLQRLTAHTHTHGQQRQGTQEESQKNINSPSHFQLSLNKLTRSHLFARRQHSSNVAGHNNLHGNKHHINNHHEIHHHHGNHGLLQRRFHKEQLEEMGESDFIEDALDKEGQEEQQDIMKLEGKSEKQQMEQQVGISDCFLLSDKNSDEDQNQLVQQRKQSQDTVGTSTTIAVMNSSCEEDLAVEGVVLLDGECKQMLDVKKISAKQQLIRQIRQQTDSQATIDLEMENEEQEQEQKEGIEISNQINPPREEEELLA